MKSEHQQPNLSEESLTASEKTELERLAHDSNVQTYLRLQGSIGRSRLIWFAARR